MFSSPFFRQGITELACKQGKIYDEVKEFSKVTPVLAVFEQSADM